MATIVLGVQWGDEGKGKLCDILASGIDICARATGGRNCGHTVVAHGKSWDFHMLPSGLLNPKTTNLIGPGVVVHIPSFFREIGTLETKGVPGCENGASVVEGRLLVSGRCALNLDIHAHADRLKETLLGAKKIGTTGSGIGPAYGSKAERTNITIEDAFHDDILESKMRALDTTYRRLFGEQYADYDVEKEIQALKDVRQSLRPYVVDDVQYLAKAQAENKKILIEGAQSCMLDNTYGTYPFVTSTSTTFGGVMAGLSIDRRKIDAVVGVLKAYTTRVGAGPFPTEIEGGVGAFLQEEGHEWGVSTGRKRRCGWLDLVVAKYSHNVNHYDVLNLTKLDILDKLPELKVAIAYKDPKTGETYKGFPMNCSALQDVEVVYETLPGWQTSTSGVKSFSDLPENARKYVGFIEDFLGVGVKWIGCGPGREDVIEK